MSKTNQDIISMKFHIFPHFSLLFASIAKHHSLLFQLTVYIYRSLYGKIANELISKTSSLVEQKSFICAPVFYCNDTSNQNEIVNK